jgi:hypothetical protein
VISKFGLIEDYEELGVRVVARQAAEREPLALQIRADTQNRLPPTIHRFKTRGPQHNLADPHGWKALSTPIRNYGDVFMLPPAQFDGALRAER